MKHVFRTTRKYWATEDGGVVVLLLLMGLVSHFYVSSVYLGHWLGPVLSVILMIIRLPNIGRLRKARLEIDEQTLVVADDAEPTCIAWKDLLYVSLLESHRKPLKSLCLGLGDARQSHEVVIPLDHFDHRRIWQLVELYAPPAALAKDAHRQVAAYQELEADLQEVINRSANNSLTVRDSWWVKGLGGLVMLLSVASVVFCFSAGGVVGILSGLFCLVLGLLGGYLVLITGTLEVNQETITRKVPLGCYAIRWDEIKLVYQDPNGCLMFCGENKHLGITGPICWSGALRHEVEDFINAQIELRGLKVKLTGDQYGFAKNTKIT